MAQTTSITLLTGDYGDRLNVLWAAAQAAKNDQSQLTADEEHPYDVLKREYDELKAESERDGLRVTLQAIGRKGFRALKEKHPPRTEGEPDVIKGDRLAGVNVESVEDDLVYASLVEPKFDSRSQYDEWADALSEGEFQTILRRAWELANIATYDPKSLPASPTRNGVTSGQ